MNHHFERWPAYEGQKSNPTFFLRQSGRSSQILLDCFAPFLAAFRRRDQVRCFHLYLEGLHRVVGRKSVEAIVRAVAASNAVRGLAQSLQNFINQSPWDERILWTQLRHQARAYFGDVPWIGVLDEIGMNGMVMLRHAAIVCAP